MTGDDSGYLLSAALVMRDAMDARARFIRTGDSEYEEMADHWEEVALSLRRKITKGFYDG